MRSKLRRNLRFLEPLPRTYYSTEYKYTNWINKRRTVFMYSVLAVAELIPLALDSYYQEMWYRFKLLQQMTDESVSRRCKVTLSIALDPQWRSQWATRKPLSQRLTAGQIQGAPSNFLLPGDSDDAQAESFLLCAVGHLACPHPRPAFGSSEVKGASSHDDGLGHVNGRKRRKNASSGLETILKQRLLSAEFQRFK